MAQLSPQSPSRGNAQSPPTITRRRRIDETSADQDKENASPKPSKRAFFYDGSCDDDPPSSPFAYDARNDTVDMAKLVDDNNAEEVRQKDDSEVESGFGDDTILTQETVAKEYTLIQEEEELELPDSETDDREPSHYPPFTEVQDEYTSIHLEDDTHIDDTCLSTFSAVPNVDMTAFAKLGGSPTKQTIIESPARTSRPSPATPKTAIPDMSPTPRRRAKNDFDTMNLLDFTEQLNYFNRVSQRYAAQSGRISSPRRRSPLKPRESMRSPAKYSLLDFDIPPAPTPRSIPTITPRELESLKSEFLSEISSLRATLSGKEAEVFSLKQAVSDAERRVGEALEEVRNEAIRKEALEVEQAEWERRGKEMETILREVRAEIVEGEREKERITRKGEEAEKCKEQLEGRIVELESQLEVARKTDATATPRSPSDPNTRGMKTAEETAREVQDAVEKVARELHTLYKGKHESKVAALKKSYEARWEKRVREAEHKLRDANEEIERLKTQRDSTLSGPVNPNVSVIGRDSEELEAEKRVLEAQIKGLQQEMASMKRDSERLYSELKTERTEKGELVAAVDEWLAIQAHNQSQIQTQAQAQTESQQLPSREASPALPLKLGSSSGHHEAPLQEADLMSLAESESNLGRSVSRGMSGIRPPSSGSSEKKQGRRNMYSNGGHSRTNSGGRSGIAMPGRSGIMNSIERMGRGGN